MNFISTPLLHIAYAENDEDDQFIFKEALQNINNSIALTLFKGCDVLLKQLAENKDFRPDILFLDMNMPGNRNFECLSEIRKNSQYNFPVIIYSTSDLDRIVQHAYASGATKYVVKPLTFTGVKDALSNCIFLFTNGQLNRTV